MIHFLWTHDAIADDAGPDRLIVRYGFLDEYNTVNWEPGFCPELALALAMRPSIQPVGDGWHAKEAIQRFSSATVYFLLPNPRPGSTSFQ